MRFDLILRPSDWRPRPPIALALGDAHSGELARGDEQLFRFTGQRGQLWDLALSAAPGSELDPALQVFAGEVAGGEALGSDDDGGEDANARLVFDASELDATWLEALRIKAKPFQESEGHFALTVSQSGD